MTTAPSLLRRGALLLVSVVTAGTCVAVPASAAPAPVPVAPTERPSAPPVPARSDVVGGDLRALDFPGPVVGTRSVLVVPVYWDDSPTEAPPLTEAEMEHVGDYYAEVSYGALSDVDVTQASSWARIAAPPSEDVCGEEDFDHYADEVDGAAQRLGYDADRYDYVVSLVWKGEVPITCEWSGRATLGGRYTALYDFEYSILDETLIHELGHNFGLGHSRGLDCYDDDGTPVAFTTDPFADCISYEYGDPSDIMGSGTGHLSYVQKQQLGWYVDQELFVAADARRSRSVLLRPMESKGPGVRSVTLFTKDGWTLQLETRRPVGEDVPSIPDLYDGLYDGVLVRLGTQLLDMTPGSDLGVADAALPPGQSWTDPAGTTTITVGSASAVGTRVTFTPVADPAP